MTAMAARATAIRDAAAAARERLGRLRPDLVPGAYRGWVLVCWLLTAVLAVVILIPALTAGVEAQQVGTTGPVGVFRAPLHLRLAIALAGAVLTGGLVVIALLRERQAPTRRRRVVRETAVLAAGGFPALVLAADREWVAAGAAVVLLGFAELILHRPAVATRGGTALGGVLAGAPWLVLLVAQVAVRDDGAGSWAWIALFGFAAAFAAFGAYYGVARAAASRIRPFSPLFRDDLPRLAVLGVVLLVVAVAVLRLTVAREVFGEPDATLWSPFAAAPISWIHAAVVAALVVLVAARSVRHPLRRSREGGVTAGLAAAGNADLVVAVAIVVLGLVVAVGGGGVLLPDPGPVVVAALKLAGVAAVLVVVLLPAFRGSAARALGLVTGVYLIPLTVNGLLRTLGVEPPAFPASPVQVALLLVLVAVVAALVAAAGVPLLGTGLTVRLAVVPLVAVHAGLLLPAAWSDAGRVVTVLAVLVALLFLLPPLAATPDARAHDLLTASAGQVLALAVFALAIPSFVGDPALVVLGLFWLSIAVIVAGVVRTDEAAT